MSHSEPSLSTKKLCDFQHWRRLANVQSFLQPLALNYSVDLRGTCHQRYCFTSVAAQRFGRQRWWSFPECFSSLVRLLESPDHVFPHYHNTLREVPESLHQLSKKRLLIVDLVRHYSAGCLAIQVFPCWFHYYFSWSHPWYHQWMNNNTICLYLTYFWSYISGSFLNCRGALIETIPGRPLGKFWLVGWTGDCGLATLFETIISPSVTLQTNAGHKNSSKATCQSPERFMGVGRNVVRLDNFFPGNVSMDALEKVQRHIITAKPDPSFRRGNHFWRTSGSWSDKLFKLVIK